MTDIVPSVEDAEVIAERAAEAIRALIHATEPAGGGLADPADVDRVLGLLETMAARLPRLFGQLGGFLEAEAEAGRMRATDCPFVGDVPAAVATAVHWLQHAGGLAERLRPALQNARVATGGLTHAGNHGDED